MAPFISGEAEATGGQGERKLPPFGGNTVKKIISVLCTAVAIPFTSHFLMCVCEGGGNLIINVVEHVQLITTTRFLTNKHF